MTSAMGEWNLNFAERERVERYTEQGPAAFAPGHGGIMQMIGVLLAKGLPDDAQLLVVSAGGSCAWPA